MSDACNITGLIKTVNCNHVIPRLINVFIPNLKSELGRDIRKSNAIRECWTKVHFNDFYLILIILNCLFTHRFYPGHFRAFPVAARRGRGGVDPESKGTCQPRDH